MEMEARGAVCPGGGVCYRSSRMDSLVVTAAAAVTVRAMVNTPQGEAQMYVNFFIDINLILFNTLKNYNLLCGYSAALLNIH